MATAYLLASVLTLIVVLVHGQEAFPEQGNIVVVAEDSFEDELNSFTDLILPGSANTRAECIQKKKCKNKGGTCQNKGNTCPGKFVKGCSKGCSCCLPEEISCKPSKRCKRANGACIARGECNGKIISTGCKKPRSCKKTHVCCVQDELVTDLPTCRGDSRCPVTDSCPNSDFTTNYVCEDCNTSEAALDFVDSLVLAEPDIALYPVFADKDYSGTAISFISFGGNCLIKKPVHTWDCVRVDGVWTECKLHGYCTGESSLSDGVYISGTLDCPCPYDEFQDYHVCEKCEKSEHVMDFVKGLNDLPGNIPKYLVFAGKDKNGNEISYTSHLGKCLIEEPVQIWSCDRINEEWKECSLLGFCTENIYLPDNLKCPCPNPIYEKKHVCPTCQNGTHALAHTINNRPTDRGANNVFDGRQIIPYEVSDHSDETTCKATHRVMTWNVYKPKKKWVAWVKMGLCGDIQSALNNGHLFFEILNCYNFHDSSIWSDGLCPRVGADFPAVNSEMCMEECKSRIGCTAFDYQIGVKCIMRECPLPVPEPDTTNNLFNGYYLFTGFKVYYNKIWSDDQCRRFPEEFTTDNHMKCMEKCKFKGGCTAVDFKVDFQVGETNCILRKCTFPVPEPNTDNEDYNGYYQYVDFP